MAGAPGTPNNFIVQQANQQILTSWDLSAGATSYLVQRSQDNVTYSLIATVTGSPLATSYLDTAVTLGTQYWYKVAASNGFGDSLYTQPQSSVPAPTGEMCLSQIRLAAQQRADRINSNFVTKQEWTSYINQSLFELYDLLTTIYEDYFLATPIKITCDGVQYSFPLPNGSNTFQNADTNVVFTPKPFYKLMGVDLALNTANNAYVTVNKFNFIDRNRFVYPNTASTIYGVFNLQYRVLDSSIQFIPTPSGGQILRLWYIPRLTELLQDTDTTTLGVSGWVEYAIVRAAKYALDKEESDTTKLDQELLFLKARIEETAANRDAGQPDKVSNTRAGGWGNGWFSGNSGSSGGWAIAPIFMANNITNTSLINTVLSAQNLLRYGLLFVSLAYLFCLLTGNFGGRISFARTSNFISSRLSAFSNHIINIVSRRAQKQMVRTNTQWIVAFMTNPKSFIKRPIKQLISNSRGYVPYASYGKPSSSPIFSFHAGPKPTSIGFYNVFHKSSHWINYFIRLTHTKLKHKKLFNTRGIR